MQARLQVSQFPTRAAATVAIAAALLGSGVVGYSLKAQTVVSGPGRVVQVTSSQPGSQNDCLRLDQRKAC
ncbi:MAG: hypothetical protein WBD38_06420 [Candidatus Dormiibacterota bacterium]